MSESLHTEHAASHGSVKSYMIGFLLSVVLTVIPFWLVMGHVLPKGVTLVAIFLFAIVQVLVHLKYFLHLDFSTDGRWNTLSFIFTMLVIVMLVGLSIWIIFSANALMM